MIQVSNQTARRFILGRQGLYPGRRWRGMPGVVSAMRAGEALQLDPLSIGARSQDIILHSRVLEYKPEYLYQAAYEQRQFFDYGGWLAMYPMEELPYWRHHMEQRERDEYVSYFVKGHKEVLEFVRAELRRRGPLRNRDLEGKRPELQSYRGRKDTSIAMFDMWLCGELMIHHRQGFDRVYDFRGNIAPKEFDYVVSAEQAEQFFARKLVAWMGLKRESRMGIEMRENMRREYSSTQVLQLLGKWRESGMVEQVQVEGRRETYLVLTEDLPALEALANGRIPDEWQPLDTTTLEEATLLSPLDIVSARGRAKLLFNFEYKWEVYTPVHLRRWGYYVLPILYGDDLVARLDPRLDRETGTLKILGFWLEEDAPQDADFGDALARGLKRFAGMLGAKKIDLGTLKPVKLRKHIKEKLK
jgi:uncharacterized protein YcaQ